MAKKRKRNVTVKDFKAYTRNDIMNLSRKEAQDLLKKMREEANKQLDKLDRAAMKSSKFYSPAGEKLHSYYDKKKTEGSYKAPSKTKIADAKAELSQLNSFFNSRTSSVTESQKVSKEQDMRIFGPSLKNPSQPAYRTTREERAALWAAYNEFRTGVDTARLAYLRYGELQSQLGNLVLESRRKRERVNVYKLLNDLKERLTEEEYEFSDNADFSGDGDDFDY